MSRKSLVQRSEVDHAINAHNCQASKKHRLTSGDKRLKVWNERSPDHYCLSCALAIIEADIAKLQALGRQLRGEEAIPVKTDD